VLDAGATETGRPYFVMELVRGIKITEFCDQKKLSTRERLDLFISVCRAVQHAHQKGVIHRDLKPSNILVTILDGAPIPKVIDFGIAKATSNQPLTDKTLFTGFSQFIGTPAYMSPEQAEMSAADVDTRTDIYSLGVLLYELLTGKTPFDAKELLAAGFEEMRRTIREKEPLRPSTRLSTLLAAEQTNAASLRQTEPPKLVHLVRGDLDWIVMKALEKDRTRRYETANALAIDLQRHLNNEPVLARPPSRLYEFQKTVRRHKLAFAAAGSIMIVLTGGVLVSTWQAVRATRAGQAAVTSQTLAEQAQAKEQHQRELAEVRLYAADMYAAQHAFENGNLGRARELLKAHWPSPGETDLRGFEWRYLWNLCQGDNFHTLSGHSRTVQCVAFSPDGELLASGGADSSVKLWDVATRRLVVTLPAHNSRVHWLAFSNDGEVLGTVGDDGIKLWNVKTHQLVFTLEEKQVARIAIAPAGTLLAIGYGHPVFSHQYSRPVKLWDFATHQVVKTFPEPGSRLAFSPNGKILAAACDNDTLKLWNVETGQEMRRLDNAGEVLCLSFSPDGQTVAAGNWAGEVQLWNVATGERVLPLLGHTTIVWSLAFSPDGRMLATGSTDQTIRFWNLTTGKEESKLVGHGSDVKAVAFAPDGQTLATGGKDAMVMLWSTAPKRAETLLTNVNHLPSFSPDNKLVATYRGGGTVTIWDVTSRQPVWVLKGERFGQFANDGRTFATVSTNFILRFWEVTTRTLEREVTLSGITDSRRQLRFALCGNRLAAANFDGGITLYETTSGSVVGKCKAQPGSVNSLTFSPDARLLAVCVENHPVKLWNLTTQKEQPAAFSDQYTAQGAAFSPDGLIMASASFGGTVGFLSLSTGKAEAPLTDIKEGCSGVVFAPDGRTLAVACEDGTVRLWNLATRREVAVLKHGKAPLRFVVFSSDNQTLASVCENGTMRFWDAPSPDVPSLRKEE
jgi:WD40 repeat protein